MKRIFLIPLICLACLVLIQRAEAATITSAQTGYWSNGTTWVGGVVPGASDNAVIATGHTVTLTADASITDVTINGTLSAGTYTITVSGNWDSSGGTFTYGTSTVKMTGANKTITMGAYPKWYMYNLTIGSGATVTVNSGFWIAAGGTLNISGTLTIASDKVFWLSGATSNLTINSGGTLTINGTFIRKAGDSSSHITNNGTINGTGTFRWHVGGATTAPITATTYGCNVGFRNTGTGVLGPTGSTLNIAGNLDIGDLTYNGQPTLDNSVNNINVTVSGNLSTAGGSYSGTLIAGSATYNVGGNWDSSGGTFTYGTSTVKMTGANKTITMGAYPKWYMYNLTIGSGATVTVNSGFWIAAGGTLNISGTLTIASDKVFWLSGATSNLTINSGGTLTINGTFIRKAGDSSSHITNNGTINGTGTFRWHVGGATTAPITATTYGCNVGFRNTGTGVLGPTGSTLNIAGNLDIGDLTYNGQPTLDNSVNNINVTVSGNLSTAGGSYSGTLIAGSATYNVGGNWNSSAGTFTCDTSTINFDGSGTQTLNSGGTGTGKDFYNLTHSGAGTLQIIINNLTVTNTLTNSAGTIDLNGLTLTLSGSGSNLMSNSATITETGSSKIVRTATSCLLTDSSGSEVSEYIIGTDKIYVRVVDEDENLDGTQTDTLIGVTVTGGTNGDSETLTLTETGNATEIFLSSGLTTTGFDGSATTNDGVLELSAGETITVTYTDDEDSSDNSKSDTATCRWAAANFLVSASSPQIAGTPFTLTITARKSDGTTDTAYIGPVNLTLTYVSPTTGTKNLLVTSTSNFSQGVVTVTQRYDDCGTITITATDSHDSTIYGISNNVVFVPYDFTLTASSLDTTASGSSYARHTVNKPFTLAVTARNASAETTPNYQGTANLIINYTSPSTSQSGSLGTSSLTSSYWSSGIATLSHQTYNKWGTITITCTDSTLTTQTGTSSNITFIPKDFSISLSSPPSSRTFYYTNESFSATVTARDYNNSTVSNYAGTVTFIGRGLNLPANYIFTTSDSGSHLFQGINGTGATSTTLSVKDTTYTSVTGTSSTITIKSATIKVISTTSPVGKAAVTIKIVDSEGNLITEDDSTTFKVTLTEAHPDGSASCKTTETSAKVTNGLVTIYITDNEAEKVTITLTNVSQDITLQAGTVTFGTLSGAGIAIPLWREIKEPTGREEE